MLIELMLFLQAVARHDVPSGKCPEEERNQEKGQSGDLLANLPTGCRFHVGLCKDWSSALVCVGCRINE